MWQLYKLLKPGIPEQDKETLVDEVVDILKAIPQGNFIDSLLLLFGEPVRKENAGEFGLLFIKGIKKNKFFLFHDFIKRVSK